MCRCRQKKDAQHLEQQCEYKRQEAPLAHVPKEPSQPNPPQTPRTRKFTRRTYTTESLAPASRWNQRPKTSVLPGIICTRALVVAACAPP